MWGVEETVRERFGRRHLKAGSEASKAQVRVSFLSRGSSRALPNLFGPAHKALVLLDETRQAALRKDLEQLWTANNRATDGTTDVEAEYLEVIAVRQWKYRTLPRPL